MAILDIFRRNSRDASDAAQPANITTVPWQNLIQGGVDAVTSPELALRIATVYRCADILSKGVAQLPLVIKRNKGGYFAEDDNDSLGLSYLLRWRPNERMSAFEMKRSLMLQLIFRGNALVIPFMGDDTYTKLVLCAPDTWTYEKLTNKYTVHDQYNSIVGVFDAYEVIHIKNLGIDGGMMGESTLAHAAKIVAVSANADRLNVDTFRSGGMPRGFVSGKGGATVGFGQVQSSQLDKQAADIQKQLEDGRNIAYLPGEMSFNQFNLSPKDIELLQTKQFNVLEICRFFGVHPDKVFAQQSTNYKASEMSQVSFLTDTLQPYLTQIEEEFQIKLLPSADLARMWRIDFDIEPLMQTDLATKADYLTKMLQMGAYTVNDIRRINGLAPVEHGDDSLVSANLIKLGSAKLSGEDPVNEPSN